MHWLLHFFSSFADLKYFISCVFDNYFDFYTIMLECAN